MKKLITLDMLQVNEKAIIDSYKIENGFTKRLKDLGLVKGTIVNIYCVSPFLSPVCIESQCGRLLLRRKNLKNIYAWVEK